MTQSYAHAVLSLRGDWIGPEECAAIQAAEAARRARFTTYECGCAFEASRGIDHPQVLVCHLHVQEQCLSCGGSIVEGERLKEILMSAEYHPWVAVAHLSCEPNPSRRGGR